MPVSNRWYDAKQNVVLYEVSGRWSWVEFSDAWKRGIQMLAEVPHTVHALVVMQPDVPKGYIPANTISNLVNIVRYIPPNSGISVTVSSDDALVKGLYDIVGRINPQFAKRAFRADSIEEALENMAKYELQMKR